MLLLIPGNDLNRAHSASQIFGEPTLNMQMFPIPCDLILVYDP